MKTDDTYFGRRPIRKSTCIVAMCLVLAAVSTNNAPWKIEIPCGASVGKKNEQKSAVLSFLMVVATHRTKEFQNMHEKEDNRELPKID